MSAAILYHFAANSTSICRCASCRRNGGSIKSNIKHAANRAARKQRIDLAADGIHIVRGIVKVEPILFAPIPNGEDCDSHVAAYESQIEMYEMYDYDSYVPELCECGCGKYR